MMIEITSQGKSFVAIAKEDDSIIFSSGLHPRPGCAMRDVVNYLYLHWGLNASLIQFDLKEWK